MQTSSPFLEILVIEQDGEVISAIIAFLAEINEISLHIFAATQQALKGIRQRPPDLILFADPSVVKETKNVLKLLRSFPSAISAVFIQEANSNKESEYQDAGVKKILYRDAAYFLSDLRQFFRENIISSYLPAMRAHLQEVELEAFLQKLTRLNRGDILLQYRITGEIVAGSSGIIYKAEHLQDGRIVAIQLFSTVPDVNEESIQRVIQEAKAFVSFDHPGVAKVYKVEQRNEMTFIVSEYVEGETLATGIERSPLGFLRVLDLGTQIADALDAMHRAGFIHGAIRPSNIIVTRDGAIKLLDFFRTRRTSSSATSFPLEMFRYISPEQSRGEEPQRSSDIFSIGSMLYYAATGHFPFEATNTASLFLEIVTEDPAPPTTKTPDLPPEFDRIIEKCLAKDQNQRYASAADLADALRRLKVSLIYNLPPEAVEEPSAPASLPRPVPAPARISKLTLIGCILLMAITAALFYSMAPRAEVIPAIAILPFAVSGYSADTEYIANGLTEGLIASLTQIGRWQVLPLSAASRYGGSMADIHQLAQENGINVFARGTVKRTDQKITIHVEVARVSDDSIISNKDYISTPEDLLTVQNQIAQNIVRAIGVKLDEGSPHRFTTNQPRNSSAYPYYLKARYLARRNSEQALLESLDFYEKALREDPAYALAYTGIAEAWITLAQNYQGYDKQSYPQASVVVQKALRLDPGLAPAYRDAGAIELLYRWNFTVAEKELRRAIAIDPSDALAHSYLAALLTATERADAATTEIHKAAALEPYSDYINEQNAFLLVKLRRYDEALTQCKLFTERSGNPFIYRIMGDAYLGKGMYSDAQEVYRLSKDLGSFNALIRFATALASGGLDTEARAILDRLGNEKQNLLRPDFMAAGYASLGEKQKALDWLDKAYEAHPDELMMIKVDFVWDSLRNERRFRRLVNKIFAD